MAERTRVIGLGAGGHAKVVLEALAAVGGYEVVGLLDPRQELWGQRVLGIPVAGDDSQLPRHYDEGVTSAFVGVGGAAGTATRRRLYEHLTEHGFALVSIIHPAATISPSARLGAGATVLAGAVVNADASIGANALVNTAAIVEHDCSLGDHVHVASGARLASGVSAGNGVHVGIGATVIQGVTIGAGSIVGAGAVVLRDVEPGVVVAGIPAKVLRLVGES
jgi:sugar O-acyltransferase (sialic acid O-acetyltransferase NeuD family)